MTGVLSLDDLQDSSSNDSGSTASDNSDSDSAKDELRELCDELGADFDHAMSYVNEHGGKDDLIDFAQRLANDDELWQAMADYRQGNGINRIIYNVLRPADAEFTTYTSAFYGDSEDPEEGTYNFVQQRARENDGNLMYYQALFPEPVAEKWDSQPVLWREFDELGYSDDQQDTNIYVPKDFVDQYSDFTIEVDGKQKPRPPSNDELGSSGNGSSSNPVIDPAEYTVDALRAKLDKLMEEGVSSEKLSALEAVEAEGKDRKTAKKAIRGAANQMADRESSAQNDDTSDNTGEQAELSDAAKAGQVNSGETDIPPEKVIELMNEGWSKEEVIEFYG